VSRRRTSLLVLVPLYLAVATAVGFADYHARLERDRDLAFTKYVPEVVAGTAEPPGRYRVLAPWLADVVSRATPFAPITDWLMFRWLSLVAVLVAGHIYYRTWFDDAHAAVGNLVTATLLPLTFTNSWPNPDQFTELALFTWAATCIARGSWSGFLVALVLNAFNRETSAFLVLLYAAAAPLSSARMAHTAVAALVWLGITVGLRWQLGYVAYDPWQWRQNLGWLVPLPAGYPGYKRIYGWFFLVLTVPLAALAARGWTSAPRFVRVAAGVVAPAYVVAACLFSSTIETRIFTMLFPLLGPAVLVALFDRNGESARSV
jgi:hypothetical protein